MPLHYVRHERCAVRPCYDGLRAGAASERPTPTRCANASVWPKRQQERERERERLHRHSRGQTHKADSARKFSRRPPPPPTRVLAGPCAAYRRRSEKIRRIRRGAAVSESLHKHGSVAPRARSRTRARKRAMMCAIKQGTTADNHNLRCKSSPPGHSCSNGVFVTYQVVCHWHRSLVGQSVRLITAGSAPQALVGPMD